MRVDVVALACLIGVVFSGSDAFAATQPKQNEPPVAQEAPVEAYVTPPAGDRPAYAGVCAPRAAYRGHRRVHLDLRACRPLFS